MAIKASDLMQCDTIPVSSQNTGSSQVGQKVNSAVKRRFEEEENTQETTKKERTVSYTPTDEEVFLGFFRKEGDPIEKDNFKSITAQVVRALELKELKEGLKKWCAAEGKEYANRVKATESILKCYKRKKTSLKLEGISSLPPEIGNLTHLEELDLSGNKLTSLPEEICALKNLRCLHVSKNLLAQLPKNMGDLTNLEELNLEDNAIEELPATIGNLTKLIQFYLGGNHLKKLPDEFRNLSSLKVLYVGENRFTHIPDVILSLKNLEELSLSTNRLRSIPDGIDRLENLSILHLNQNRIASIPAAIGKLKKLTELEIKQNLLSDLPDALRNLSNLEKLLLAENQFEEFPRAILSLVRLQILDLENNELENLPDEISHLRNLSELKLQNNNLRSLPMSLAQLSEDCDVNLEGNRLRERAIAELQAAIEEANEEDSEIGPTLHFDFDDEEEEEEEMTLEQALESWTKDLNTHFVVSETDNIDIKALSLSEEQSDLLTRLLKRLKATADYKHEATQPQTVSRVFDMLDGISKNEKFRESCFNYLGDAFSSCGDRVAIVFNYIGLLHRIHCSSEEMSSMQIAELLIGAKRLELLDAFAKEKCNKDRLGDEIQVQLYCQIRLKSRLGLPIDNQTMLYESMGRISDDDLGAAAEQVEKASSDWLAILMDHELWINHLSEKLQEEIEKINADANEALERAETSGESIRIGKMREQYIRDLMIQATQNFLGQCPLFS